MNTSYKLDVWMPWLMLGVALATLTSALARTPTITGSYPAAGQWEQSTKDSLAGINLKEHQVQLTAQDDHRRERFPIQVDSVTPVEIYVDDGPTYGEQEPNDTPRAGPPSDLPLQITGRIDKPGDRDTFPFLAAKKQIVFLDVLARRTGSRLNAAIRLLDSTGKQLIESNDVVGRDARLTFTATRTGTLFVEVRNRGRRAGDDYFYRLRVTGPLSPASSLDEVDGR